MKKILLKHLPSKKELKRFYNTYAVHNNFKVKSIYIDSNCIVLGVKLTANMFNPAFYIYTSHIDLTRSTALLRIDKKYFFHVTRFMADYRKQVDTIH